MTFNRVSIHTLVAVCLVLSGCGNNPSVKSSLPAGGMLDNSVGNGSLASEKVKDVLNQLKSEPEQKSNPKPESNSTETESVSTFKRGTYLRKPQNKSGAGPSSTFIGQYGKERLDNAAVIKNYAPVSIIPIGLDAYCKTAWAGGHLHTRIALMGPPDNMKMFLQQFSHFKIAFRDQAAAVIQDAVVPAVEFKRAPPNVNHGSPTFEFEGEMEIPLEQYERFYDWTLNWQ